MKNATPILAAALAGVWLAPLTGAHAATIVLYDFQDSTMVVGNGYDQTISPAGPPVGDVIGSPLVSATVLNWSPHAGTRVATSLLDPNAAALPSKAIGISPGTIPGSSSTPVAPSSTSVYFTFTVTNVSGAGLSLDELSFDLGLSETAAFTYLQNTAVYVSVNAGALTQFGPIISETATTGVWTGMINRIVDLATLPVLAHGDTAEFRIAFGDNAAGGIATRGTYVDNFMLTSIDAGPAIPAPAALPAGLALLIAMTTRRRRAA